VAEVLQTTDASLSKTANMDNYLPEPAASRGADQVHNALQAMLQSSEIEDLRAALQSMLLYYKNILDNVEETKYRRISYTNPRYKKFAAKFPAFERMFLAAGFVASGGAMEWQPLSQSLDSKAKADDASIQLLRFAYNSIEQARTALPSTIPAVAAAAAPTASVAAPVDAVTSEVPAEPMPMSGN
jgi:hypothetical protein